MRCVAFSGSYSEEREFAGKAVRQTVNEYVILTRHGLVHYKFCVNPGGKTRVFTDVDYFTTPSFDTQNWSDLQHIATKHPQHGRTKRACAKNGATFLMMPYETVEGLAQLQADLDRVGDAKARTAWETITGNVRMDTLGDILGRAEELVAETRTDYLHKKALEMATVDPDWGMF